MKLSPPPPLIPPPIHIDEFFFLQPSQVLPWLSHNIDDAHHSNRNESTKVQNTRH